MIDRTEHDERVHSKKSRETVDDDPADGPEPEVQAERPEEAGSAV